MYCVPTPTQIINSELPHLTAPLGAQSDLRGKAPDEVWASIGGELPINTTPSGPLRTGLTLSTSQGHGQGTTGLSSFDLTELVSHPAAALGCPASHPTPANTPQVMRSDGTAAVFHFQGGASSCGEDALRSPRATQTLTTLESGVCSERATASEASRLRGTERCLQRHDL